jgi:hypothetical protein
MCAAVHPNPGPAFHPHYSFVQFNCNGIGYKSELSEFLDRHQVKIAAIQETKLTVKSKTPNFQGYCLVRKDRPVGRGGGLAFLVHQSVRYTDLDVSSLIPQNDQTLEIQGVSVFIDNSYVKVFNVYIPPASANANYVPDLSKVLDVDDDTLILGDFYAHDVAWSSNLSDARGDSIAQQISNSNFFILNNASLTRCPSNSNCSLPDISLISAQLALSVSWVTCTALNSDHLPISITFYDDQPPPRTSRSYVNFKRAKWGLFTS